MRTAYRCRAYLDADQVAVLNRTFGCVRLVWNKTLAERHRAYYGEGKRTSYRETDAALTGWKRTQELEFLREVPAVPLQQTLRHQHTAFSNFFAGRARYPRFRGHTLGDACGAGVRRQGSSLPRSATKQETPLAKAGIPS